MKHPINIFLLFQIVWAIACALNPQLPSPFVGVLGIVIHFYNLPLLYIIPHIFQTKEELIRVLKIYAFLSIPLMILGVIQFFSPVGHPINTYVSDVTERDIALVGESPRVTSTFSFISGYATYLSLIILLVVYLLTLKNISFKLTVTLYIILAFAMLNILTTGSRGPTIFTAASIVIYLFLAGILNKLFLQRFLWRFLFSCLVIFCLFTFTPIGPKVVNSFMIRFSSSEDIVPRLIDTYTTPFKFIKIAGLYGFGIGSTYQGSEAVGGDTRKLQIITGGFEEEPERVVIEMGVCGFVLVYLIRLAFIIYFFKMYLALKDEDLKFLALISGIFQLQFLGIQHLFFNVTSIVFYWFILGFLFLLPKLDQQLLDTAKQIENINLKKQKFDPLIFTRRY